MIRVFVDVDHDFNKYFENFNKHVLMRSILYTDVEIIPLLQFSEVSENASLH